MLCVLVSRSSGITRETPPCKRDEKVPKKEIDNSLSKHVLTSSNKKRYADGKRLDFMGANGMKLSPGLHPSLASGLFILCHSPLTYTHNHQTDL